MSNLNTSTSFEENNDPLQQLLAQHAQLQAQQEEARAQQEQLQAQIAALLPGTSPTSASYQLQHHRSPIHKQPHQHRRSNVPRSMSSNGTPMGRQHSSDWTEAPARSRTLSNRSTPMARTNSKGSSSRTRNLPFTQTGAIPPPLQSSSRENPAIAAWMAQEQPLGSYTFTGETGQQMHRSTSQRKPELQQVPEHARMMEHPSEFLSRTIGTPILSISPPVPSNSQLRQSSSSFNTQTPSTPSTTESLTTATTLTSDSLSRQNSFCGEPLLEGIQMMKFNSNTSYSDVNVDHTMYDQVTPQFPSSRNSNRSSNEEQSQVLFGAGGASLDSQISYSLPTQFTPSPFGEKMEKSQSSESIGSSSSSSRNVQRLQAQINLAAARPIMPKGGSDENVMSRDGSSQSMDRNASKDGLQDKLAISKPVYQRPTRDRVQCKQCDAHPEGFRGEHELRRHQDREHKPLVRKFICVEPPTNDGITHAKPIVPLSRCKACGQQKKKYGAYYNAAAHLRRTHFKPKTSKSRSKNKMETEEKRGGKGGGEWPPMSELKYWMKEVEEAALEYPLSNSQQDEADASDEEIDNSLDEQFYSHAGLSGMNNSSFDHTVVGSAPSYNAFAANANSDMFNMQIPLESRGQCMDQTMFNGTPQDGFSNFSSTSFYQNDPLTFFDPSLNQHFDDQPILAGLDFVNFETFQ